MTIRELRDLQRSLEIECDNRRYRRHPYSAEITRCRRGLWRALRMHSGDRQQRRLDKWGGRLDEAMELRDKFFADRIDRIAKIRKQLARAWA